jgi:hypothetical protein
MLHDSVTPQILLVRYRHTALTVSSLSPPTR